MPSPFPGMNPFLEQPSVWHDFHTRFAVALADQLSALVGTAYLVRVEEHVYLHELSAAERQLIGRPDVHVSPQAPKTSSSTTTLSAPCRGRFLTPVDEEKVRYLEIIERSGRRVTAVIEILSPSNKLNGPDRDSYLSKRLAYLRGDVHFIELDLLRGGPRMPIDGMPACDYCAAVSTVADRPNGGIWPFGLREAMPIVPIPLRRDDPAAPLDLKAALDRVYDAATYRYEIYQSEPVPALSHADAGWAAEILKATAGHI